MSVLEAVGMTKESGLEVIYFGTANKLDFAAPKSSPVTLHRDLVEDLLSNGFLEDDVILFATLGDIISNQAEYQLAGLKHVESRIRRLWERGGLDDSVEAAIEGYLRYRPGAVLPFEPGWLEFDVEEARVTEYQDVRVEVEEHGFISAEIDAVCDCKVSWEADEDFAVPADWAVELISNPWGNSVSTTLSIAATVGLVFDEEQQHFSTAVWQGNPLDMEFLHAES